MISIYVIKGSPRALLITDGTATAYRALKEDELTGWSENPYTDLIQLVLAHYCCDEAWDILRMLEQADADEEIRLYDKVFAIKDLIKEDAW